MPCTVFSKSTASVIIYTSNAAFSSSNLRSSLHFTSLTIASIDNEIFLQIAHILTQEKPFFNFNCYRLSKDAKKLHQHSFDINPIFIFSFWFSRAK